MITVVIPAYNEEKTISDCLKLIAPQKCELIVVAGGTDSTAKIASEYANVLVDKKCTGPGYARNIGAKAAKGKVILFTDADTLVPPNWVESYEKEFSKNNIVAAGGVVKPLNGTVLDKIIYKTNQDLLYKATGKIGFFQLSGNNSAYRKKEFLAVGGFDEEMGFLEDTELPMRMKKIGKLKILDIPVLTSPRRMKNRYLAVWKQFMRAYTNWLLLGKKPGKEYFESSKQKNTKK